MRRPCRPQRRCSRTEHRRPWRGLSPPGPSIHKAQIWGVAEQRTPVQSKSSKAILHVENAASCFSDCWLPILKGAPILLAIKTGVRHSKMSQWAPELNARIPIETILSKEDKKTIPLSMREETADIFGGSPVPPWSGSRSPQLSRWLLTLAGRHGAGSGPKLFSPGFLSCSVCTRLSSG